MPNQYSPKYAPRIARPCAHCGTVYLPVKKHQKCCSRSCGGALRSSRSTAAYFWAGVARRGPNECWLWTRSGAAVYGQMRIRGRKTPAHRIAYELTSGPIPPGMFVCHACDRPRCCNPAHLWLGSHRENMADMVAKGRQATGDRIQAHRHPGNQIRGERHPLAKVTAEQVRDIRARYVPQKVTLKQLAAEHGLTIPTVHQIVSRATWKHITP